MEPASLNRSTLMSNPPASETRFWWPLDLSPREEEALSGFRRQMLEAPVTADADLTDSVSGLLSQTMRAHVADIIERDSLPHLSHILNGWGDVRFGGVRLMERLESFIHRDAAGRYFILQCDPEGEFHPWQSFAYAVMAGVDPDAQVPPGTTLRELARNSRHLQTREGRELGHLLFALAYLDADAGGPPFSLDGEVCDLRGLMERAVEAHHYGSFEVCRKFHLTEGLCAVAARVPGFEAYRAPAQGFLDGQLDMLLLLGIILREAADSAAAGKGVEPGSLLEELRDTLVLGNYVENHAYYAGHLIELGTLAEGLGYHIAPEQRSAMAFVVNELNRTIPAYLSRTCFAECFLHFGHYRRAVTLLGRLDQVRRESRALTRADLADFTVDFDATAAEPAALAPEHATAAHGPSVYEVALSAANVRPAFGEIVNEYRALAPRHFEPRGKADHFRRISPPWWPRAFHYELLDYGRDVGLEIHLESDEVRPLAERVRPLTERVAERFPGLRVGWDEKWSHGRGRLRVIFGPDAPPPEVAAGMLALIEETFPHLDPSVGGQG